MIHPTAIIKTDKIGKNTSIGAYSSIDKGVIIGDNCVISSHVVIGTQAETLKPRKSDKECTVIIGQNTTIKEFVTINAGAENDTMVGDNCYIMAKSHIGHDCKVDNNVIISTGAIIGGYSIINEYCNIGLGAVIHPRTRLASFCLVSANGFLKGDKSLTPCIIYIGNPAIPYKVNNVAIDRFIENENIKNIMRANAEIYIESVTNNSF